MKKFYVLLWLVILACQSIYGANNPSQNKLAGLTRSFDMMKTQHYEKQAHMLMGPDFEKVLEEIRSLKKGVVSPQEMDKFLISVLGAAEHSYNMLFLEAFDNEITTIWTDQQKSFDYLLHLMEELREISFTEDLHDTKEKDTPITMDLFDYQGLN